MVEKLPLRFGASDLLGDEDAVHDLRQPRQLQFAPLGGGDTVGDDVLPHSSPQTPADGQGIVQEGEGASQPGLVSGPEALHVHALYPQLFEQQKKASRQQLFLRHFPQLEALPVVVIDLCIQRKLRLRHFPADRAEAFRKGMPLGIRKIQERIVHIPENRGEPIHCPP